jgi:hypothetical protein
MVSSTETGVKTSRRWMVGPKIVTRMACWNVRTMKQEGMMKMMMREMRRYNISIAALSEVRWKGEGMTRYNDHTMIFTGEQDEHKNGVAIVMDRRARRAWTEEWKSHGPRLRFEIMTGYMTVVAAYAPTNTKDNEKEASEYYKLLSDVTSEIPKGDMIMMMGDLNARVAWSDEHSKVMGRYTMDKETNENGYRLIDFCIHNDLHIMNTYFRHKKIHQGTWQHPSTKEWHMIDYILTNKRYKSSIEDIRVYRGADMKTDHHLLITRVRLHLAAKRTRVTENKIKIDKEPTNHITNQE